MPGRYQTGQDIVTCGVVGAMISGLITTLAIQGLNGAPLAQRIFVDPAIAEPSQPAAPAD